VAPSLAHILRDSEEEAIRALLLALRHVHWPRLPVWFPLHPPVPAILPVQGPFPTTGRAALPSTTPQQLSAQYWSLGGVCRAHRYRVSAQLIAAKMFSPQRQRTMQTNRCLSSRQSYLTVARL
jgi:hypothetical protein